MTFLAFALALYLVPALLASSRNHPGASAIWVVNALLGWTVAGWIMCLVWALSEPRRVALNQSYTPMTIPGRYDVPAYPAGWTAASAAMPERSCHVCGRPVMAAASFCPMCGATLR